MNAQEPKDAILPQREGHYAGVYQYGINENRSLSVPQQVAVYPVEGQDRAAGIGWSPASYSEAGGKI